MPTGYTADVQSGKVTTFPEFALQCARAFGALVLMREDPANAPIPNEFKPSDYHIKALDDAREKLAALSAMSSAERDEASSKDNAEKLASWEKYEAEKAEHKQRYEAMLAKVEAWEPPTPDHTNLKIFMTQQITKSISFDCGFARPKPTPATTDDWFAAAVKQASWDVSYHTKENAKEIERANGRTEWVRALRQSLET